MSLAIILLATFIAIFAIQLLRFDKVFQSSSERRGCLGDEERRTLSSWKLKIPGNGYPCGTSVSPINSYPWVLPELPVERVVKNSKSNQCCCMPCLLFILLLHLPVFFFIFSSPETSCFCLSPLLFSCADSTLCTEMFSLPGALFFICLARARKLGVNWRMSDKGLFPSLSLTCRSTEAQTRCSLTAPATHTYPSREGMAKPLASVRILWRPVAVGWPQFLHVLSPVPELFPSTISCRMAAIATGGRAGFFPPPDEAQAAALLQGSCGSSPLKWRPCVSPLWPQAWHLHGGHTIANEPSCRSEAVGDN